MAASWPATSSSSGVVEGDFSIAMLFWL